MNLPILATLLTCACLDAAVPPGGYYTTRYDHIDVENILNQKRLVQNYAKCFLNKGPCTPQGLEFKRIFPEAVRTRCLRCTEKQLYVIKKSVRRLQKEYPKVFQDIMEQWDPTGEYVQALLDTPEGQKTPEIELDNRFNTPTQPPQPSTTQKPYIPTSSATTKKPSTSKSKPSITISFISNLVPTQDTSTTQFAVPVNPFIRNPVTPVNTVSEPFPIISESLKTLSSIGTQVVQTGARIADVFVSSVQNVLGGPRI